MAKAPRIHKETARTKKLRELWVKAAQEDLIMTMPDESTARQMRFQLYNAVRAIRQDPDKSPELAEVLEMVQVALEGPGKNILRIGRSKTIAAMDDFFQQFGITGEGVPAVLSEEEVEMQRSLERLSQIVAEVPGDGKV